MSFALPENASQLRQLLAVRMGIAAVGIGVAFGGVIYYWGNHRAENALLDRAEESVRHFQSPIMVSAVQFGGQANHDSIRGLIDPTRFVGIRVFRKDRSLVFENWADIPGAVIAAAKAIDHRWPSIREGDRHWIDVPDGKLIRVVLPLVSKESNVIGFVEGFSRLDEEQLRENRRQVFVSAWGASLSVLLSAALLYPLMVAMLSRSANLSRQLLDSNLSLLRSLGNAIAKRDSDTDAHNYRVTCYAVSVAEALGMQKDEIAELVVGAFLHDIGKIGVPDRILTKPAALDEHEFEIMKSHAKLGVEIVADNIWLSGAAKTIRHHHERFDGSGYPDGLRGNAIPVAARVFAVVDVFDALTSARPYKPALPFSEALAAVEQGVGSHFDPRVVDAFLPIAGSLYARTYCASEIELKQAMQGMLHKYFGFHAALSMVDCIEKCEQIAA